MSHNHHQTTISADERRCFMCYGMGKLFVTVKRVSNALTAFYGMAAAQVQARVTCQLCQGTGVYEVER